MAKPWSAYKHTQTNATSFGLSPVLTEFGLTSHINQRYKWPRLRRTPALRIDAGGEEHMRGTVRVWSAAALLAAVVVLAAGCGGGSSNKSSSSGSSSSSGGGKGGSINVAIVDNPQMKDIAKLTPSLFTAKTGIKVNYTVLDEGTLRQVTTRDVAAGGRQFDVAMIGPFEAPQFGKAGNLVDLTQQASSDPSYQLNDVIPAVRNALSADGKLYAAP